MDKVIVDENSGVPLIGTTAFGIIYRDTNMVELRPNSGCNLNCIYCSVDQGPFSKSRVNTFEVDAEYLIKSFIDLKNFIGEDVNVFLSSQGEIMLHPKIDYIVKELSDIEGVKINFQTNGVLLSERFIKKVSPFVDSFNVSLNSLNPETSAKLCGMKKYDISHLKKMCGVISENGSDLVIAPVIIKGYNDKDLGEIIEFAKSINKNKRYPILGVQNYLSYPLGREPKNASPINFYKFREYLKEYEKKYDIKLWMNKNDFFVKNTKKLPCPFRNNEALSVKLLMPGILKDEFISSARGRAVSVSNCSASLNKSLNVKVWRTKYNIIMSSPSSPVFRTRAF